MEHSMSGGVIKQYESKTLVKVRDEAGVAVWFSCALPVFEGDFVMADGKRWRVESVQNAVTANASPVPFRSLAEVEQVLFEEE